MTPSEIIRFVKTDIWRIRQKDLPPWKWRIIRPLQILVLSFRGFSENRCQMRASALTYYTLLSIVPIGAMAFGIARGFGLAATLENLLYEKLQGQEEAASRLIAFSRTLLENTRGGLVAGIGVLFLVWVIIRMLSTIEESFNEIWGILKPRSLPRKISDYLSLMLIGPVLFAASSALTVIAAGEITAVLERFSLPEPVAPAVFFFMNLTSYGVTWILFTFIYLFMPNTRVHWKSGLIAGVVSGTLFELFQWIYIHFQIGVANYNAIYGGFAALPLFLVWLQISWVIVLLGAELSFAHQNVHTYEFEPDCLKVSHSFRRLLSLRIANRLVKNFEAGGPPLNETGISHDLGIPIRLVRQILFELSAAGVISRVQADDERTAAYQPARDPEVLTVRFVLDALDRHGTDAIPVEHSAEMEKLSESLKAFGDLVESSPANRRLIDI
jgi:membrane protein